MAKRSVWILLSLSEGKVGTILRSFSKASFNDSVRWRSRTLAMRWIMGGWEDEEDEDDEQIGADEDVVLLDWSGDSEDADEEEKVDEIEQSGELEGE